MSNHCMTIIKNTSLNDFLILANKKDIPTEVLILFKQKDETRNNEKLLRAASGQLYADLQIEDAQLTIGRYSDTDAYPYDLTPILDEQEEFLLISGCATVKRDRECLKKIAKTFQGIYVSSEYKKVAHSYINGTWERLIDSVIKMTAEIPTRELIDITMHQSPWIETYNPYKNCVISLRKMRKRFSKNYNEN